MAISPLHILKGTREIRVYTVSSTTSCTEHYIIVNENVLPDVDFTEHRPTVYSLKDKSAYLRKISPFPSFFFLSFLPPEKETGKDLCKEITEQLNVMLPRSTNTRTTILHVRKLQWYVLLWFMVHICVLQNGYFLWEMNLRLRRCSQETLIGMR